FGDDVDAGVFLFFEHEHGRVALGVEQRVSRLFPWRPELVRLRKPGGLGQASGKGRFEQHGAFPKVRHYRAAASRKRECASGTTLPDPVIQAAVAAEAWITGARIGGHSRALRARGPMRSGDDE